jgi:hypothetical protein
MSTRIIPKKKEESTSVRLDYFRIMKIDHVKRSSQLVIPGLQRWRGHAEMLAAAFYEVLGLLEEKG